MALIHEKICAVMEECGAIAKDSRNPQQGYKYRGIDAVMNALNPAFRKHKIFVIPSVQDMQREERTTQKGGLLIYSIVTVLYTFYAEDGSSISCIVTGEGMDSGDKSANKAMSAAFKYACFQTFCIPTEEMKDSEEDSPEPAPKRKQKKEEKEQPKQAPGIGGIKAKALATFLKDNGVPEDYILKMNKRDNLESLTEAQHTNIITFIDTIKEKYNAQ